MHVVDVEGFGQGGFPGMAQGALREVDAGHLRPFFGQGRRIEAGAAAKVRNGAARSNAEAGGDPVD